MVGKKYKLYGYFDLMASQSLNSVKGKQIGVPRIKFQNNDNEIRFQVPNAFLNVNKQKKIKKFF